MKYLLFIFGLMCSFGGCTINKSNHTSNRGGFQITVDTITIPLKGIIKPATRPELTHVIKFNNTYYCIFKEKGLYSFMRANSHLLILNENGTTEHIAPLPEEIVRTQDFDLFVNHDTIFVKTRREDIYYLDHKQLNWIPTDQIKENIIFEDDRYYILQWKRYDIHCTSWFKNKQTGVEYEFNAHSQVVNKIDSTYYITSEFRVLKIDNPEKLLPCEPERYYQAFRQEGYMPGSESTQGVEILYGDSVCRHLDCETFEEDPIILTSFICNNELYHIGWDSLLCIAKLISGEFTPVQYLNGSDMIFELYNPGLMKVQKDNGQMQIFWTDNPNLSGIMDIKDNKINIRYLKHEVDSVEYLHKENFPLVFDFICTRLDSLHINVVDSLERKINGTPLQIPAYHSYYPYSKNYTLRTKGYLKTEDEMVTSKTCYDFTENDSLVKSIFLEWMETKTFSDIHSSGQTCGEHPPLINCFSSKLDDIVQTVTCSLHTQPQKTEKEQGELMMVWKSPEGLMVELFCRNLKRDREIRMIVYKE